MMFRSKKAVSPLIATILLIVFSIALGAVVMSWGEAYIEEKAEFVKGTQETVAGCDAAFIKVIQISGVPQICVRNDVLEVFVENGPSTEIYDLHARIVGTDGIAVRDSVLSEPLMPADAEKVMFRFEPVGQIRQVKITPMILRAGSLTPCTDKGIIVENVNPC
ncbi:hypothetical protein KY338_04860 [Candidatus Woesearchaeota archaeon]|nr:hypothetical protein [Candidatus Woesearchaeota archaeon]MBW3006235.1 hypothetical protein [Candidatus Woesearchaeota archaeon]